MIILCLQLVPTASGHAGLKNELKINAFTYFPFLSQHITTAVMIKVSCSVGMIIIFMYHLYEGN